MRRPALVEHQSLAHSHRIPGLDALIPPCGLPKPRFGCTVGAVAGGVLLVLMAKEVPVVLVHGMVAWNLAYLCNGRYQLAMPNTLPWITMYMHVLQVGT